MSVNITVIIPTRNRAALLSRTLESLCHQTCPVEQFEIRVIDNDSTDETKDVCAQLSKRLPNLFYHHNPVLGLHAGRHEGMKVAKGNIVVFTEDDIRAFPCWIDAIAKTFNDSDVVLVGGKILPDYEGTPPSWLDELWVNCKWGRWFGYYGLIDLGDEMREIPPTLVWGGNFAIRKEVVFKLGGFHPDGMPKELIRYRGDGETALSKKIMENKFKTIYNPNASIYHFVSIERMTRDYLKVRSFNQGISTSFANIRHSGGINLKDIILALIKHTANQLRYLNRPIWKMMDKNHWRGYCFHRKEVKKDSQLLSWVLKTDYL